MKSKGSEEKEYFAHKSAFIDGPVNIGKGTKIWHYCHIMAGAVIGENCSLGQNVFIGSKAVLGNRVKVQNNVSIYDGVELENGVFCGPSMVFTNVINPRSHISRKNEYQKTLVKKGATIGANVTILCGNTIGRYAFIGASSVITDDVPDYGLVYGNPGRIQGWVCECGVKLNLNLSDKPAEGICPACGKRYRKEGDRIKVITSEDHPANSEGSRGEVEE